jgi:hypothetical protein
LSLFHSFALLLDFIEEFLFYLIGVEVQDRAITTISEVSIEILEHHYLHLFRGDPLDLPVGVLEGQGKRVEESHPLFYEV